MNITKPSSVARCVMALGTTSGAGKSWLATALCRWYARQGLRVVPFKAQNMSTNARVVAGITAGTLASSGSEIGSAQYFQALAARAVPEVRMNPLLLKPEHDTHRQVVLMGQVNETLSRVPWRGRSASVWPQIAMALTELRAENAAGLGLLPVVTTFEPYKTVQRTEARFEALTGIWAPLSGVAVQGYEIHHGRTAMQPSKGAARVVMSDGLAWRNSDGNVLGLYLHGLFEVPAVLRALFGAQAATSDSVFDGLADFVEQHFTPGVLASLID